jgi:hypothetical protein
MKFFEFLNFYLAKLKISEQKNFFKFLFFVTTDHQMTKNNIGVISCVVHIVSADHFFFSSLKKIH